VASTNAPELGSKTVPLISFSIFSIDGSLSLSVVSAIISSASSSCTIIFVESDENTGSTKWAT